MKNNFFAEPINKDDLTTEKAIATSRTMTNMALQNGHLNIPDNWDVFYTDDASLWDQDQFQRQPEAPIRTQRQPQAPVRSQRHPQNQTQPLRRPQVLVQSRPKVWLTDQKRWIQRGVLYTAIEIDLTGRLSRFKKTSKYQGYNWDLV